jgi:hypothetical protein
MENEKPKTRIILCVLSFFLLWPFSATDMELSMEWVGGLTEKKAGVLVLDQNTFNRN